MLEALGQLDASAVKKYALLIGGALEDDDHNVRLAAAEALGRLGDEGLTLAIARLVHSDWRVRSAALVTIQKVQADTMDQMEAAGAVKRTAKLLGDREAGVRHAAGRAL